MRRRLGTALIGAGVLGIVGAAMLESMAGAAMGGFVGAALGYTYAIIAEAQRQGIEYEDAAERRDRHRDG